MSPTPFINTDNFAPARFATINSMLGLLIPVMFIGITLIALVILFRGALTIMTSEGDEAKFVKGKETFKSASLGIIIIFISFFLVRLITRIFEIPFFL